MTDARFVRAHYHYRRPAYALLQQILWSIRLCRWQRQAGCKNRSTRRPRRLTLCSGWRGRRLRLDAQLGSEATRFRRG